MVSIESIKELRNITGVSIGECKKALEKSNGDIKKAEEFLKEVGKKIVQKRMDKETAAGIIDAYIHTGSNIGVLVELNCESDFVARSEDFQKLAHELCLQIAVGSSDDDDPILERKWIKDESKTIQDLINESIGKFGENISIKRFTRYEL